MKINPELVVLNVVNSFLLAFRWFIVACAVGLALRTWSVKPLIIQHQLGGVETQAHGVLTAEQAGAMEDGK